MTVTAPTGPKKSQMHDDEGICVMNNADNKRRLQHHMPDEAAGASGVRGCVRLAM